MSKVWSNKISYSITTPSSAVAFGTTIEVKFTLSPLLKGLKIGQVTTSLRESQLLRHTNKDEKEGYIERFRTIAEDRYCMKLCCIMFFTSTATWEWKH